MKRFFLCVKPLARGMFFFMVVLLSAIVLPLSCRRTVQEEQDDGTELSLEHHVHVEDLPPKAIVLAFLEGDVRLERAGFERALLLGEPLSDGDIVRTGPESSAEFLIEDLGSIRLLPDTRWMVNALVSGADSRLDSGAVLVKLRSLLPGERFTLSTGDSLLGVRGTSFMVRSSKGDSPSDSGQTVLAVKDGSVAMLNSSPLLDGLMDGALGSAKSRAVLDLALSLAPRVGPGEELVSTAIDRSSNEQALRSLSELLVEAENMRLDWTLVENPEGELAARFSEADREAFRRDLAHAASVPLSQANRELLALLDHVREPGQEDWVLSASLPMERLSPRSRPPLSSIPDGDRGRRADGRDTRRDPRIAWVAEISSSAIADPLTRVGSTLIARTEDGVVYALSEEGAVLWSDRGASDSLTALHDSVALVSGDTLRILDAQTGRERGIWSAQPANPGSQSAAKPVPVPEGLAMLTPRGIAIVRSENAALVREILVPEGFSSAPILAGRELVAVSGKGEVLVMDPSAGTVLVAIKTSLSGPCLLPRWSSGRLVVASRSGTVLSIDLGQRSVQWERSTGKTLEGDVEVGEGRLFIKTGSSELLILDIETGEDSVKALSGVDSPPLLSNAVLWYGTADGKLIALDARSLEKIRTIDLGERVSVRPIMIGERLYAGTRTGKIIRIDPNARY